MSEQTANSTATGGGHDDSVDDNDRVIKSMQEHRERFIFQLVKDGKLPSDKDDREFLLKLMEGATKSAHSSKKAKVDEKTQISQQQLVLNLAEAVRVRKSQASAQRRKNNSGADREVPVVNPVIVPGHTDIGAIPISAATFSRSDHSDS